MFRGIWAVLGLLALVQGCTRQDVELSGRPCTDGTCADGYRCNRASLICCALDDVECATADGGNPDCVPSPEICNGEDDDCDGGIDNSRNPAGCVPVWADRDGDGFGAGDPFCHCAPSQGYVDNNLDPDDSNGTIYPNAAEICDGLDNNSDGDIPATEVDNDGDGFVECTPWVGAPGLRGGDCNDNDALVYPEAPELCDGVANNCGPLNANETDPDNDFYVACNGWNNRTGAFPGIIGGGDCQPTNGSVNPGATEIFNGIDDNCDGRVDPCFADCDCGPSIVACWPLDSMPTIDDQSPTNADGTVTGTDVGPAHITSGPIGNAYNFNGNPITATVPQAAALNGGSGATVTIMAWVYATAYPGSNYTYVIDISDQHRFAINSAGVINFASGQTANAVANTAVPLNEWVHVAGRRSGGRLTVFLNGAPVADEGAGTPIGSLVGPACIGSNQTSGSCGTSSWRGAIDHLQVFNSGLSNATICNASGRLTCP